MRRSGALPRPFRLLWGATATSNFGDGLRLTALPLLATTLTTDPRAIAGIAVATQLPWLVFILPGGAWADRFDRRVLRMRLDIARAVVMVGLVGLIVADDVSMTAIYLVAVLLASAEAVVDSSSMALVPATVDERDLERAGSRLASTELVVNGMIGPPIGGVLFAVAAAVPFAVDAASFAGAATTLSFLHGTFRPEPAAEHRADPMRRQISDGFRWFWRRPALRNLALVSFGLGTVSFVGQAVFVLFATETLGLSSGGYGFLLVPAAFGGVAGSLLAPRLTSRPLALVLTGVVLVAGLAMLLISVSSSAPVVALLLGVNAGAVLVWNVLTIALRQRVIPDHLLGRVGASYRFLVYLGMPFGALAGGFLAEAFGLRTTLAVDGIALVAIACAVPMLLRGVDQDPTATRVGGAAAEGTPA